MHLTLKSEPLPYLTKLFSSQYSITRVFGPSANIKNTGRQTRHNNEHHVCFMINLRPYYTTYHMNGYHRGRVIVRATKRGW